MSAATIVRKASKLAVAPAGVFTRRRVGDVVVLLYHRVGPGTAEIELSATAFDAQLAYLRENEHVMTLDAALAPASSGGVVVTFDDGTVDFHGTVMPLLVRHRMPAVLYLATGLVAEEGGDGLTWGQVTDCVASGLVTIGSHTHSHADLSKTTEAAAGEEMRRSKDLIEDRLGVACEHFAYPWAVGSPEADRAARRLFRSAALDAWRTNRAGRIDPYRLGRTPVLRSDGALFRAKARGYLDGEAWLYRALGRGPWGRG
jgi:peptidoglycan/xylan/chitin deacetylase (PgdA/CDA1 family)